MAQQTGDLATFLANFRPFGDTAFVGIVPDGSTGADTFNGADSDKAANWIVKENKVRGIYFTCDPTRADLRNKPTERDITASAAVWAVWRNL